jgi:hypothetical protein
MSQTNLNMMRSFTHPTKPVFVHEYKTNQHQQQQLGEMESNPLLLSVNNLNRQHESASKELTLQNLNTLTKSLQTNIYNQVSLQKQQFEQLQMGNFNKHEESPIFNNVNHHHHHHHFQQQQQQQQQQQNRLTNNNNNELGPSSSTSATASVANANVNNTSSAANASIMVEEQLSQNKGAMKLPTFWYAIFI